LVDAIRYQISNREQGTREIRQLETKLGTSKNPSQIPV
jgi:hypothetical protein